MQIWFLRSLHYQRHLPLCRYIAIMAPAVLVFQRQLRASFSADAQTPHETSFRTRFQAALQDACHALQNPDLSEIANFEKAAEPLHTLAGALSEQCRCVQ